MINYLWLGLVLIAILMGMFKSFTGDPVYETPPPQVVMNYDQNEGVWQDAEELTADTYQDGEKPDDYAYKYEIGFDDQNAQVIDLNLTLEGGKQPAPTKKSKIDQESGDLIHLKFDATGFQLPVQLNEGTVALTFTASDADGERFQFDGGTVSPSENPDNSWVTVSFTKEDIVAGAENISAQLDFPVLVESLRILNLSGEDATSTTIAFASPRYTFDEVSYVDEDKKSDSWMLVLTKSITGYAKFSIDLAISLIGIMMFWLGLMRVAEKAGLVNLLAKAMKPVMVLLFPDIKPDGDAMGAILMNVAANMLGLGNAATPLGIKAMKELQKENPYRDYASNAQCMLLSINTSSVTLLPASVISFRAAAGSENLMEFWPAMVGATCIATIVAVLACKILEKLPVFAIPSDALKNTGSETTEEEKSNA